MEIITLGKKPRIECESSAKGGEKGMKHYNYIKTIRFGNRQIQNEKGLDSRPFYLQKILEFGNL